MKSYFYLLLFLLSSCVNTDEEFSEIAKHLKSCELYNSGVLSEYSIKYNDANKKCIFSVGTLIYDRKLECSLDLEHQKELAEFYFVIGSKGLVNQDQDKNVGLQE